MKIIQLKFWLEKICNGKLNHSTYVLQNIIYVEFVAHGIAFA
jgi:hypothetical protein